MTVVAVLLSALTCQAEEKAGSSAKMAVHCPAFEAGQIIPERYTADGRDVSPEIKWERVPEGAKSLVLICEDPDAPRGTWLHWLVYDINPRLSGLVSGVKPATEIPGQLKQGKNSWNKIGYGGPSPPKGPRHRYFFILYALDDVLNLPGGATRKQVAAAMQGHVVAKAQTMGTYQR
jgi:Raf kinase inhibitor-like YbhB/YbcL family protein